VRQFGGPVATLVWLVPGTIDQVRMTLEVLNLRVVASKMYPFDGEYQTVRVNGRPAEWLTNAHEVIYFSRTQEVHRQITTHVLVWESDLITYRLEADVPLEEAIKVAESLKPIN
jgi:hypothetical protein